MKTLKKTLCLVLAVVMVVGVLVLPANAAATTTEDTDATAAFKTLNEYGVMYGVDANNTPALSKNINRQDMAAIVYRIMTGDTTDKYKDNYASAADEFADSATFATWAKGYIGYVRNQGIFVGDNKGNFKPTEEIAGSDVLTVLLRCIGYGKNNEFTGANYAQNALTQATQIHMFGGVTGYKPVAEKTMDKAISRGVVAKLTFNAIQAPMVTYFNDTYSAYSSQGRPVAPNTTGATLNPRLIQVVPGTTTTVVYDEWGVPTVKTPSTLYFNNPIPAVTVDKSTTSSKALVEYKNAVTQCDLAEALGMEETKTFLTYTNGIENKTTTSVNPLNTTAQIGAQGRYTAVYENPKFDKTKKDSATNPTYILVYKDTLLAKVTEVKARTYDAAGHLKTPATMKLDVYDAVSPEPVTLTSKTADFTWTKGQYLLINYHQNDTVATNGNITADVDAVRTATLAKSWEKYQSYVTKTEVGRSASYDIEDWNVDGTIDDNDFIKVLQEAPSFVGAQTLISYNSDTHTIDKVVYNDNNRYYLDGASKTMKVNFTWYQDTYGNVIGSSVINAANSFGVINKIYWTGSNGDGYVYAEVTYVDGTTDKLAVNRLSVYDGTAGTDAVEANAHADTGIATNDYGVSGTMTFDTNHKYFYVNADAKVNATADAAAKKIINNDLFKIVASTTVPGTYDFTEVGGTSANAAYTAGGTSISFDDLANDSTDMVSGRAKNGDVRVGSETVFLVRSGSKAPYTFTSYVGYGKIGDYVEGEVDYAYTDDEDTIADVVYITANAKGEQGWHLFFNTAVATSGSNYLVNVDYDSANYIVHGILDGEVGTIKVKASQQGWTSGTTYDGAKLANTIASTTNGNKLWMVYIKDGYVIDINGGAANGTTADDILKSIAETTDFTSDIQALNEAGVGMLNASAGTPPYGTDPDELGAYEKLSAFATVVEDDTKIEGETITLDSNVFSINGNTPLVGSWSDLATAEAVDGGYQVIIVCDKDKKVVESYIFEAKAVGTTTGTGTAPTTPVADKLTVSISGNTVTVNWHGAEYKNIAPTVDEAVAAIKAKLAKDGWTDIETSAAGGTYTFKCAKTVSGVKYTDSYTWNSTDTTNSFVKSIRIKVDDVDTLIAETGVSLSTLDYWGSTYKANANIYVYAKVNGAAETLVHLSDNTALKEGDTVKTDMYVKLNAGTISAPVYTNITDETAITGGSVTSATAVYDGKTQPDKASSTYYLKVGETYKIKITLVAGATMTVASGKVVNVKVEAANSLKAVEGVLMKANDTIATGSGTSYTVDFTVTLDSSVTTDATLAITLTGANAAA